MVLREQSEEMKNLTSVKQDWKQEETGEKCIIIFII
jgi:hypothetical protein